MRRSYKCRVYPNKAQRERLDKSLDLLRYFYNAALAERKEAWRLNRVSVSCFDQIKQISAIRSNDPDYMTVQCRSMEQTLRQLDKAFRPFFKKQRGFPRFKPNSRFNTIIYNRSGFRLRGSRLNLSLIGDLKIKLSRPIEGTIKEVTAKREGSKWFAVISCVDVPEAVLPPTGQSIGIDVGIKSFATLSDGTQIDNWKYFESAAKKMRVAQRRVSRRKKGSHRRRKAVAQLRSIYQTISNKRHDFQHKLSTDLIRQYDLIAVEKLNVKGLCRGMLAKQIHDVAWSSFTEKLMYKAECAGRQLVKVDARGTSQTCVCGAEVKKDLGIRWHECLECGLSEHRDIVSAKIILSRGLRES